MKSGGIMGKVGRPKAQITRNESLTLRFSKFEREKIFMFARLKFTYVSSDKIFDDRHKQNFAGLTLN